MKKILAFAGSNSSKSINAKLIQSLIKDINTAEVTELNLSHYPLPIFGEDIEKSEGYPQNLKVLLEVIKEHDALIISVNEHNGSISAFFKNVLDWLSRIEYKFLTDKKVLLFSASPGKRGALTALEYTAGVLPRYNGEVFASTSFPSFSENFDKDNLTITNTELKSDIDKKVADFLAAI